MHGGTIVLHDPRQFGIDLPASKNHEQQTMERRATHASAARVARTFSGP